MFLINNKQKSLKPSKYLICSPILCKLNSSSLKIAAIFFEFCFKLFKEGKRIGSGTGKTGKHLAVSHATHLDSALFHYGISKRNLAITCNSNLAIFTNC